MTQNQNQNQNQKLKDQLIYVTDLRVPGYLKAVPENKISQLDFIERSSLVWYQEYLSEIMSSMGKRFLPIYRMADGEFIFCVGPYPDHLDADSSLRGRIRHVINTVRYWIKRNAGSSMETCWGESYSGKDLKKLRQHFIKSIKEVAQSGKLAIHFTRSPEQFSEQYFRPVCDWLKNEKIPLSIGNYLPFYFVYALLCGPDGKRLMQGKNVLIVTSADEEKKSRICSGLIAMGVGNVQFLTISSNNALIDLVDLSGLDRKIDLALIGAGIGSVNILAQLKPLNTVCIDAGVCIEIFADAKNRQRIFTIPDEMVNGS